MSLKERLSKQNATKPPVTISSKNLEKLKENATLKNQKDDLDVLETLFDDDTIGAIFINGAKNIYIQSKGRIFKSSLTFKDNTRLMGIMRKSAKLRGLEIDELNPYLSFKMSDGIFVNATVPPVSNVPVLNIKFYREKFAKLPKILEDRAISKEMALTLEALIATSSENILIIGKKNTFKTTLLSALAKKYPKNLRAVMADFKQEIIFPQINDRDSEFPYDFENFIYYDFGTIEKNYIDHVIDETMVSIFDFCPDRLFFNSPDEKVISKILQYMQEGQKGIVMTLCADSIDDAIKKMMFILLKNNPYLTYKKAKMLCYELFDVAIQVGFDESSKRKIKYITELIEDDGTLQTNNIFFLNPLGEHQSGGFTPEFYKRVDPNFVSLGVNIFDVNYKHTYDRSYETIEEISYKVTNENETNKELENFKIRKRTNKELVKAAKNNLDKLKQKITSNSLETKIKETKENNLEKLSDDEFEDEE